MARLGRASPGFHFRRWQVKSTGAVGSYNLTAGDTLTSAEANTTRRNVLARLLADTRALSEAATRSSPGSIRAAADVLAEAEAVLRAAALARAVTDIWNVGTTQRMAPDAVLAATHLAGAYTDIDDDPDSPDGLWLTTDGTPGEVRLSFATPTVRPKQGTDIQEFRVRVRPG